MRVLRIGRKKTDGGYETHGILFSAAIPYKENTADYYLKYMKTVEHTQPDEIWGFRNRAYSWFYWFRKKTNEERQNLKKFGLTVHGDISNVHCLCHEAVPAVFPEKLPQSETPGGYCNIGQGESPPGER